MSVLYRRRYVRYDGPIEPARTRYTVIAETELKQLLREKWVRRLLIMAWLPVVGFAVYIYFGLVVKAITGFEVLTGNTTMMFFRYEVWFVAIMMAAFGSGMICRDLSSKALTLYFTRPLNVDQYLWGKFLAVASTILAVTLVPGVMLAIMQWALSESIGLWTFLDMTWRIAAVSALGTFLYTSIILLLSSLGSSSRGVGLVWLALFVFLDVGRALVTSLIGDHPLFDIISLRRLFEATAEVLLVGNMNKLPAVIAVCLLSVFVFVALRMRLQQLEREKT